MKILAILCVRNEGAFLLDWLAHTLASGVTHVLAYSNDCDDGTDLMLDRLSEVAPVTHLRNPGPYDQGGIQFTALKDAAKQRLIKEADWILPLDVDEFINVHVGNRTLPDLINALPDATAITLTWRLFGNNGQARYHDQPVTHRFAKAAPKILYWPWRASMFKTLYKNDGTYGKPGVHRPRSPNDNKISQARWFDGHGRELDTLFQTKRIFSTFGQDNYGLAQLNHYPLGDMESYVLKAYRGRAVHSDHLLGLDYWVERNFNVEEDQTIRQLDPVVAKFRAEFAKDSQLAELHDKSVTWRKETFDKLMLEEPYRALFGRLLMTPPTQPVPLNAARFLSSYGNRARELALQNPDQKP